MTDWTQITRNARTHGDFAGRSIAEQDAFFAFFAGPDRTGAARPGRPLNAILKLLARAKTRSTLRFGPQSLAFLQPLHRK